MRKTGLKEDKNRTARSVKLHKTLQSKCLTNFGLRSEGSLLKNVWQILRTSTCSFETLASWKILAIVGKILGTNWLDFDF